MFAIRNGSLGWVFGLMGRAINIKWYKLVLSGTSKYSYDFINDIMRMIFIISSNNK